MYTSHGQTVDEGDVGARRDRLGSGERNSLAGRWWRALGWRVGGRALALAAAVVMRPAVRFTLDVLARGAAVWLFTGAGSPVQGEGWESCERKGWVALWARYNEHGCEGVHGHWVQWLQELATHSNHLDKYSGTHGHERVRHWYLSDGSSLVRRVQSLDRKNGSGNGQVSLAGDEGSTAKVGAGTNTLQY